MLNTLQRYLMRQFLVACASTVCLFVFILIIGNAVKEVLPMLASGKIQLPFFIDILWHLIPSMVAYSLPLGVLTATLLVLGRLSSHNELLAMKASGISPYTIIAPFLLLASLGTLFTLFVNFHWGPHSIVYYRTALTNLIRQKPLQFIQTGTFVKDFPGYMFFIEQKHRDWVENCWLWELDGSQSSGVNMALHAKKGLLRYDNKRNRLLFTLLNGSGEKYLMQSGDTIHTQPIAFTSTEIALPLSHLLGNLFFRKRLGHMTLTELRGEFARAHSPKEKVLARLEIQRNAVFGFGILAMILIAIPLSIRFSRTETSINLVLAIGLAMGFYTLIMAISWLEAAPQWRPDWLVWMPPIALWLIAIPLLKRIIQH